MRAYLVWGVLFLFTTMKINRVNYPNQYFLDFDEENQFIININGYKPLYHLSDLIRLRDMVEKSIETYISKDISDEIVDSDNKEYVEEHLQSCKNTESKSIFEKITKNDYLYLFLDKANNKLKIGRSENPKKRLRSIQYEYNIILESLFKLENCGQMESFVLDIFSKYNLHGEWFSFNQEIVDYFATLKSNQENGI